MLHIGGIVCYVHFFLVLYVLFTSLHTLVKMIEEASSGAVFSQIKPRSVTSSTRHTERPSQHWKDLSGGAVHEFLTEFTCNFCIISLSVRQNRERSSASTGQDGPRTWLHTVSAST